MLRRRYRTIHVACLDRLMAEAEAIRRAIETGARHAWVHESDRVFDDSGDPVWEVVLRVTPGRSRPPQTS